MVQEILFSQKNYQNKGLSVQNSMSKSKYSPVSKMSLDSVSFRKNSDDSATEDKSFLSKNWRQLLLGATLLASIGTAIAIAVSTKGKHLSKDIKNSGISDIDAMLSEISGSEVNSATVASVSTEAAEEGSRKRMPTMKKQAKPKSTDELPSSASTQELGSKVNVPPIVSNDSPLEKMVKHRDLLAGKELIIPATKNLIDYLESSKDYKQIIKEGEKLLRYLSDVKSGKLALASDSIRLTNSAVVPKEEADVLYRIGKAQGALGNNDKAIESIQKSLALNYSPQIDERLAHFLNEANRPSEAIKIFDKLLVAKNSRFTEEHNKLINGMVISLRKLGHVKESERFEAVLALANKKELHLESAIARYELPEDVRSAVEYGDDDFAIELVAYVKNTLKSLKLV